jgi:hypothetical protein
MWKLSIVKHETCGWTSLVIEEIICRLKQPQEDTGVEKARMNKLRIVEDEQKQTA